MNPAGVVIVSSTGAVEQRHTGLHPSSPSFRSGETTRCRPVVSTAPLPGMMIRSFNCRDVHRLDRRPPSVADRCSPRRGRGHGSLLHLAIEAIGGALTPSGRDWAASMGTGKSP